MNRLSRLLLILFVFLSQHSRAQEMILPLKENQVVKTRSMQRNPTAQKPTGLTLPFFEDFTDNDPYPNQSRWTDKQVYINNTMGRGIISRGVATFDALNEKGVVYYDSVGAFTTIFADSLTSQTFDMSGFQPSDSIYLSFFYQCGGYGFYAKPWDSLTLFFLGSNGLWKEVWSLKGDTAQVGFQQAMIPITDTAYFNDNFRFRWVNLATIGISNSNWNIDYIRMDKNRNRFDTVLHDLAFTADPEFLLNDFTSMPFRHFKTNPANFLASNTIAHLQNNGPNNLAFTVHYDSKDVASGSGLGSSNTNITISPFNTGTATMSVYNAATFNPPNPNDRVVFEQKFNCAAQYPNESLDNDTIIRQQVFDNYFAYDDGTAELSYFLNLAVNAPGATAIEYALYQPDTIRGVAIRFATTLPSQSYKNFSLAVMRDIAFNGGTDQTVYQENFLTPAYIDTINAFYIYNFSQPVIMNPGVFYISIIQPAGGISDSLQIALDANRVGGNHRYFKVGVSWESSQLEGALMVRPMVGAALVLGVKDPKEANIDFQLYPNPAGQYLNIRTEAAISNKARYEIVNAIGRKYREDKLDTQHNIDIRELPAGIYFFRIINDEQFSGVRKFVKY
ncbi:T9SS type A sorting domain-containing protein [Taibaiella lutea]|nr:T9SS type A sorting domain-containing protein [Taibaiella lutea]